ncbi:hypothetical protein KUL25_15900 [Rhodobacteraceae bacterium N5(2021)]|uniref:Uncharacterized protein n=2 Tax=Gymnodinialimonas phycosphaerae TaxID=2841589 RepID=A0A975U0H1_9RHOB|nr:hypothetical protein [Gymnodinialimonas phycosphaerae]
MLGLFTPVAQAQNYMGEYYAYIGPSDHWNSQGVRLGDFGAILQQDRANFHRFGIRDQFDSADPFFGTLSARSRIPTIWQVRPGSEYVVNRVLSGHEQYLRVEVFGTGGIPTRIFVSEGAG